MIPPPLQGGGGAGGGTSSTFPYPRNSPPPQDIGNPTVGSPPTDPNYAKYQSQDYNAYVANPFDEMDGVTADEDTEQDLATQQAQQQQGLQQAPQHLVLTRVAEQRARRFVKKKGKVPKIDGWDWVPFMAAIFESDTKVPLDDDEDTINFYEEEYDVDGNDADSNANTDTTLPEDYVPTNTGLSSQPTPIPSTLEPEERPAKPDGGAHRPPATNRQPPPKQFGDGSWDYVVYVPEWTDPLWDPAWQRVYGTDKKKRRPQRDVLQSLRPALRPEDAVRNPTPYARRWGIPRDRNDGRSRTSPTFSRTRDFGAAVDDNIVNQVMDDAMRARCVAETQRLIAQGQTAYRGPGIAPEVMDQYRQHVGIPSQEDIRTGAVKAGMPFERYIETLDPRVRDLYRGLIDDVLDDEDYQRILFLDMTSDEMYRNNVFTMSDKEKYSLTTVPLHSLVDKELWEDTLYRGAMVEYPRLAYDFWGKREEYDVHRNPAIWEALQPALQLVTRVLQTEPMFWRSIKDLRTRRKIDPTLDPREPEDQRTPYLQKMIRLDEIKQPGDAGYAQDLDDRWTELDDLAAAGYDYEYHVDRLLGRTLEIGFCSGFIDEDGKPTGFTYGHTGYNMAGPDTTINIFIAAELLWPLMVPIYSSSEKLCASYVIATTLLHELMHATSYAVDILCMREEELYDPSQTSGMSALLFNWWQSATDVECGHGEPWWRNDVKSELGWAFETEFWGDSVVTATGSSNGFRRSKHIQALPLAIAAQRHEHDYYSPVPIDYVAKFFTDGFWENEWPRHGPAAFKRLPPDRQHLCLMLPTWQPEVALQNIFGKDNWLFFRTVIRSLHRFGHSIMAEYLNQVVWEVRGFHSLRNRWILDIQAWGIPDENWASLNATLDETAESVQNRWLAYSSPTDDMYQEWKSDKLPPYPDRQQWVQIMMNQFLDLTRDGGPYFTAIEAVHRFAQNELRIMERMVFEFLTVRKGQRRYVYQPDNESDPLLALVNRMVEYKEEIDKHQNKLDDLQMCAVLAGETDRITSWCAYLDQDSQRLEHLCNLVLSEWQIDDPEAKRLREALSSVPSALYEKRANRLKKLAMREYTQLDYRIRAGIDEFYRKIEFWVGKMVQPDPIKQQDLETTRRRIMALQQRLQKSPIGGETLGTPLESVGPKKTNNVFAFKAPNPKSNVVDDATRRPGLTIGNASNAKAVIKASPTKQGSGNAFTFGKSGFSSSTLQPRRTTGPKSGITADAFTKYSTLQSTLTNPAPKFQGGNFASQANIASPPDTVFGRLQLPASGNPFAATNAPMMPMAPFPFPYADRNMTSRDLSKLTQDPAPAMQLLMNAVQLPEESYRQPENQDDDIE
ncbi:hypothetical protein PG991_002900 [Apiospora marii]|uniref:Uncharacterized protein n=1 Tax=Apiospora marii TaxID=335849 RepID=A0ABR1SH53_9PEZI